MAEYATPESYEYEAPPPEKKNNKTLIIILIVVAVLLLCCCCIALIGGIAYLSSTGYFQTQLLPHMLSLL